MNKKFKKKVALISTLTIGTSLLVTSEKSKALDEEKLDNFRNILYYDNYSVWGGEGNFYPADIPAEDYTHLNLGYLNFDALGELESTDIDADFTHSLGRTDSSYYDINNGVINGIRVLKQKNPNIKTGISIGGEDYSGDFVDVVKNPTAEENFIKNIITYLKYADMDYVEIAWETPGIVKTVDLTSSLSKEGTLKASSEDKELLVKLLKDLKAELDKASKNENRDYELSVALPSKISEIDAGIDVASIYDIVDFATVKTYDYVDNYSLKSGHHTALYTNPEDPNKGTGVSIDETVNYYIEKGAIKNKLVISSAFYTRGFEKVSNDNLNSKTPGLFGNAEIIDEDFEGNTITGAVSQKGYTNNTGIWRYNSIEDLQKAYLGLQEYWDDYAKAPYLYNEETGAFFTYDNEKSIEEKCNYIKNNSLGGLASFKASGDKVISESDKTRRKLGDISKKSLFGDRVIRDNVLKEEKLNISLDVENVNDNTINLTLTNKEDFFESNTTLNYLETSYKNIKNGKIYIKTQDVSLENLEREGDYYLIDLAKDDRYNMWAPGEKVTITLTSNDNIRDLNNIKSIIITERIYADSPEFNETSLLCSENNSKAVFSGIKDASIYYGCLYNPLEGVQAYDKEDGDITDKIKVTTSFNRLKVGEYKVTYTVTDSDGNTTIEKSYVNVAYRIYYPYKEYDSKTTYTYRDGVSYNNKRYKMDKCGEEIENIPPTNEEGILNYPWQELGDAGVCIDDTFKFDLIALARTAANYNSKLYDKDFDFYCDFNMDYKIDITDIVIAARNYE